jgi:hypothetical protein
MRAHRGYVHALTGSGGLPARARPFHATATVEATVRLRILVLTTLIALIAPSTAGAFVSVREAKVLARKYIAGVARKDAHRSGAEIISFDVTSCRRQSKRVVKCRAFTVLSYPTATGRCRFSVTVSDTLSGGVTFYSRQLGCVDE